MVRLKTTAFALITLAGVSIGANNMTRYQQGQKALDDRGEYCEWISSSDQTDSVPKFYPTANEGVLYPTIAEQAYEHLWNISQKLKPYRSRKVTFTYLPQPVQSALSKTLTKHQKRLREVKDTLSLLVQNAHELKTNKSEDEAERRYQEWKLDQELPDQITRLNAERSELEVIIGDLKKLRMDDMEAYRFFRQAFVEDAAVEGLRLPYLALELEYHPGLLEESVSLYPVWIEGQQITRGSEEPYLRIAGSMVPEDLGRALKDKKLPKLFFSHSDLMQTPPPSGESMGEARPQKHALASVEFLSPYRLLIKGTPYSNRQPGAAQGDKLDLQFTSAANIAVDGLLDLGCMANSRWARHLIRDTEQFLTDPSTNKTYTYEEVDAHNLKVLETLKSVNGSARRSLAHAGRPPFWERFLAF